MAMQIIDAQVHPYERNRPERPWVSQAYALPEVTADMMVAAMDDAGIDGALAVSPVSIYGFDASYALETARRFPDRFAVITPIDPTRPDAAEFVAQWARTPWTAGLRVPLNRDQDVEAFVSGAADHFLRAVVRHDQPVCVAAFDRVAQVASALRKHSDVQFVIDHLGIKPPHGPPPQSAFARLPELLALADCSNVAVKVSGVPVLSHRPYPHDDIWPPLARVFDAFGFDRTMWGSDWTRTHEFLTLGQGLRCFLEADRLSSSELERLMGGTLARIFKWKPGKKTQSL